MHSANRRGSPMNHPHVTDEQVRRAEELVSWTCRERIRFLWYRFRMTVREMSYATSLMMMPMFPGDLGGIWASLGDTGASGGAAADDGGSSARSADLASRRPRRARADRTAGPGGRGGPPSMITAVRHDKRV